MDYRALHEYTALHEVFSYCKLQQLETSRSQSHIEALLLRQEHKNWLGKREKRLPLPPLPPQIVKLFKEWFQLVDEERTGFITIAMVKQKMEDSGIPHTLETVQELMNLINIDRGGITDWQEFQSFVANELESGAGRLFLEGEYLLPSGRGIMFAAMVQALRRKHMVACVSAGGRRRNDMLESLIAEHTPATAASHAAGPASTLKRQAREQQLWLQNTAKFERAGRVAAGQSAAMQTKQQSPSKTGLTLPTFRPIRVQPP